MPKNLLVAEDSIVMQKAIGITFAKSDFKLVYSQNGLEALSKAKEMKPDAVIVDAAMVGKDGYDLCKAIKMDPQLTNTRVLLLSSTQHAYDEAKAQASGVDDYMLKPFETQALAKKIQDLLAQPTKDLSQLTQPAAKKTMDAFATASPASTIAVSAPLSMDAPLSFDSQESSSFLDLDFQPGGQEETNLGLSLDNPESFPLLSDTTQPMPKDLSPSQTSLQTEPKPKNAPDESPADDDFWNFSSANSNVEFSLNDAPLDSPIASPASEPLATPAVPELEDLSASWAIPEAAPVQESPAEPAPYELSSPEDDFGSVSFDLSAMESPSEPPPLEAAPEPSAPSKAQTPLASGALSALPNDQIEAIVTKVFKEVIERIAWEVVPDMAEKIIKEELQRLIKK